MTKRNGSSYTKYTSHVAWTWAGLTMFAALAAGPQTSLAQRDIELPTIQWEVTPAAEPDLALQYDFRVPKDERVFANGAEVYMRAVVRTLSVDPESRKAFNERYDVWVASPLEELPLDEMKEWLAKNEHVLTEIERATKCRTCDWELSVREFDNFNDVAWVRLDEFQEMRHLARMMWVKTRVEIAEGRFDDALRSIGVSLRMGQHIAQAPLMICRLIGAACIGIAIGTLEELVQADDSPNTYWAIASLPDQPMEMGTAIEDEVRMITRGFAYLRDPETSVRTAEEWKEVMGRDFSQLMNLANPNDSMTAEQGQLMAAGYAMRGYPMAKRELIADGMDEAVLEEMPVAQVVAIHQSRLYEQVYHEVLKWTLLPDSVSWKYTSTIEQRLAKIGVMRPGRESREIFPFMTMLLPAVDAAHVVPLRVKRKLAFLQTVEAVRNYLAANDGAFPESLVDLKDMPAMRDPLTGEPFVYQQTEQGARFVLEVPTPYRNRAIGGIYELSVKR